MKLYAAALELGSISSGIKKQTYEKKALEHLTTLTKWLREHIFQAVEITHQGSRKKFVEWLKVAAGGGTLNIRDAVNAVASKCLAEHFVNRAPDSSSPIAGQ